MEQQGEIKNPEFLEAMKKVREDNSEANMLEVLTHAVKAKFILPVDGDVNDKLRFHAVSGKDGKIYQVVYSDTMSFNMAFINKKQNGMVAGFMDLADMVLAENSKINGFVINPGTTELLFGEDMVRTIIEQLEKEGVNVKRAAEIAKEEAPKPASVKVGDPQRMPDGLGNAVIDFGAKHDEVFRVFVQLLQRDGNDKLEWLFIVDHAGKTDEMFKALGESVGPFLDGLNMVMIDMGDDLAEKVTEGKVPVYVK